ncbi:phosphate signaling complex protein PhoU [Actinophytocola glycyrrhizae]|uniref:Phosphate-specific transport system accessory protein PhoU n=1 Tax=Actinophytocola glycyrrhizae TaxID=2044873 RepID=A0ABV9S7J4_9PSEU
MRETFHSELAELRALLARMCEQAATAMRLATGAMLSADLDAAKGVLAADAAIDEMRDQCEEMAQQMLALQAPVAGDLRLVLSAIYCAERVERMGDLAEHIANTTCRVHPDQVVPTELRDTFDRLGAITSDMSARLVEHVAAPRAGAFAELDAIDQEVDDLHADVLHKITAKDWPHGVPMATTLALVARFYERYADQAVSAAKRVEFVCTGETPTLPA